MKRRIQINGNAGAVAGRDIHIQNLNIYPPGNPDKPADDTQTIISNLITDFSQQANGNTPLNALSSRQMRQLANNRAKLDRLVQSIRTPKKSAK